MRTWLRRASLSILAPGTFTVAVAASTVLHLELPVARRAVADAAKRALANLPAKTTAITIGAIDRTGSALVLRNVDVTFGDEVGRPALAVRGVCARVSYRELVTHWLTTGTILLVVKDVHVQSADVALDDDGQTLPRVARAFVDPNRTAAPSAAGPPSLTLVLEGVVIDHVWVHGSLAHAILDADVDRARASLFFKDDVRIRLDDGDVTTRALGRPMRARVRALVGIPKDGPVRLATAVDGTFGDATAHARAAGTLGHLDTVILAEQAGGRAAVLAAIALPRGPEPLRVSANARVDNVPLILISPDAPRGTISIDARASIALDSRLEGTVWVRSHPTILSGQRIPTLVAKATGRGHVWHVDARASDDGLDVLAGVDLDGTLVRGDASATLRDLSQIRPLSAAPVHGRAAARATCSGDLASKTLDATLSGVVSDGRVGPIRADLVRVAGKVKWRGESGVGDVSADVRAGASRIYVDGSSIHFGIKGISAASATLRAGAGRADVRFRSSQDGSVFAYGTVAAMRATDLQPFVVAPFPASEARLDGAVAFRSVDGVRHGRVHARLTELALAVPDQELERALVALDAKLDGHDGSYFASALLDGQAAFTVSSEHVHVPVLAVDRASLLAITGRTYVDANATFACLRTWFGARVPTTAGRAAVRLVYEHYDGGPHMASFEATALGAEIRTPSVGMVRGVDAYLSGVVSLDDARADVMAELADSHGALVLARLGIAFDAPVWNVAAMADLARWKRTPAAVHLEVPDRDIATLPPPVHPGNIEGHIAAIVDITGSALAPSVSFSVDERGGRRASRRSDPPVDLHVEGTYDQAVLAASIRARGARATGLDGDLELVLPWRDVLAGKAGETWEASATVHVRKLALGSVTGWFTKTAFDGTISGVVGVGGLHHDARAGVDLILDDMSLAHRLVGTARVVALLSGGRAAANVVVEQRAGRLDVALGGEAPWGASLSPSLSFVRGVDAYVRARAFDVSFAGPLLREVLPGFGAVVDSAIAVHLTSELKTSHAAGMVMLSAGRTEIVALGDELRDVRARIDIANDGKARISRVELHPANGRIDADGTATLEGLDFRGAVLHLRIPHGADIPIAIEGMPIGDLEGHGDATLTRDASGWKIHVAVPSARVLLAPALGRTVRSLEPDPHVHVGRRLENGAFVAAPLVVAGPVTGPSMPVYVGVALGDDVWVKRQSDLDVRITGKVAVDVAKELRLAGALTVPDGWVEIQGRRFVLERARLSFDGQPPSDPVVQATARYDAPGGVKIFADYVGAVSTGRFSLRSEPSMPANDIVATLIFGSPTAQVGGSSGAGSASPALQAAAAGGGYAAQGLNRALTDISPLDVSTRVDTSASANPRPELTVRVTRAVGVTLGVNLGTPSPGQPPDRTVLRTEYQFLPQWRLRSTNGDKGSAILDFIWEYRY